VGDGRKGEYTAGRNAEAHYGRYPAVYDTPEIRECDARKMEYAIRAEIDGIAAVQENPP
jgi:hypothetical protein